MVINRFYVTVNYNLKYELIRYVSCRTSRYPNTYEQRYLCTYLRCITRIKLRKLERIKCIRTFLRSRGTLTVMVEGGSFS